MDEIQEVTGVPLEDYEFETFTGLVFDALGRVLPDGKQDVVLELPLFTVRVLMVKDHQIESATLSLREAPEEELLESC